MQSLEFTIKTIALSTETLRQQKQRIARYEFIVCDNLDYQKDKLEVIEGTIAITFKFYLKVWRRSMPMEMVTPLIDIFIKYGLIIDCRYVMRITAIKVPATTNYIEVKICKCAEKED